jgi:histidine phosphotransferase ChpT
MIEGSRLASLVASKVCHDMVEPMNAMLHGIELLKDSEGGPHSADAVRLLEQGVNKAWAKLEFFRAALAGAIAQDGEGALETVRPTAERLYSALKPSLEWLAPSVKAPNLALKVMLNMLMIAGECLPKGGVVQVNAAHASEGVEITILSLGPRAMLKAETAACLAGQAPEDGYQGYNILPALTSLMARQAGVQLLARQSEERIEFVLRSPHFSL